MHILTFSNVYCLHCSIIRVIYTCRLPSFTKFFYTFQFLAIVKCIAWGMFIVVLQELHCLLQCLHCCGAFIEKYVCIIPSFIVIGYCVSELHGRYCNVLPEAVYCCFTRTTLFTKFFTCLYDQSLRLLSYHQALLLYTLWFLRYNVAKCIAWGCLLLFYKN